MEDKEIKQLRKSFREIIKDLMQRTSGEAHILCDVPLVTSNKLIKEVKKTSQFDNKHKEVWDAFCYGLAHINSGSYENPYNGQKTNLECVNDLVKHIEQKYFPKEAKQ